MKKFVSFPDIKQFREVIESVKRHSQYIGNDENGNAIYDETLPLPIMTATGSIKLHGTNAGICFSSNGLWAQSRTEIITPEHDNAGFAFFVEKNKEVFIEIMNKIKQTYNIDDTNIISLYGEWCGQGIQKGMGINQLSKMFVIFGLKITPTEGGAAYWLDESPFKNESYFIYNINDYQKFTIEIDFNNLKQAFERMMEMMLEVENQCPVAKSLGKEGIGEGIVFKITEPNRYIWKVKGEKHSKSAKVKVPKKVDDEKQNKLNECAVKVLPSWRLEQMYNETFDILNGGKPSIERTGDFLRAVVKDIMKEELLTIADAGLEPKELNGIVSKLAKNWFFDKLNEESNLK